MPVVLAQLLVLAAELLIVVVQSLVVEAKHLVGQMPLAVLPPQRASLASSVSSLSKKCLMVKSFCISDDVP